MMKFRSCETATRFLVEKGYVGVVITKHEGGMFRPDGGMFRGGSKEKEFKIRQFDINGKVVKMVTGPTLKIAIERFLRSDV